MFIQEHRRELTLDSLSEKSTGFACQVLTLELLPHTRARCRLRDANAGVHECGNSGIIIDRYPSP